MESIDIVSLIKKLWARKKTFFIVWAVTFGLSLLWILPQPRYYRCNVSLAPEAYGDNVGGVSSLASNFGLNLGGQGTDAIYPQLYPELMQSPEFVVGLFSIRVKTYKDSIDTDYATYLRRYQKKNWLTEPFKKASKAITSLIVRPKNEVVSKDHKIDPFNLTMSEFKMMGRISKKISCSVDQRTDVISISVKDQDRLVCALVADSVRQHLQDFIIMYRTKKARIDVQHYQTLADSCKREYDMSVRKYSNFCDSNRGLILQSKLSERDELENDMQMKYNAYSAMQNQLEAMKVKVQEKTPAFTTLKSATVPLEPAGPRRMIFTAFMLILSTLITSGIILKGEMRKMFVFFKE